MADYSRADARAWVRGLSGYLLVVTTPYRADGSVDYEGLRRNVAYSLEVPGVTGLYVGSIYQEFWTLTLDERKLVTETIVDACAGRGTVMVGVTSTCARDSQELARAAQDAGADALMLWPPYYGPRDDDGVFRYFESVASASDLAICSYSTTVAELGFYLTPALAERLVAIDTFSGLKEASRSLSGYSEMLSTVGDAVVVSSPLEEYTLFGLATFGTSRVSSVLLGSSRPLYVQNADHPYCALFANALKTGDVEGAAAALRPILWAANRLHNRFINRGGHNVALVKYITELAGMAAGPVRPPLSPPSEADKADARAVLEEIGLKDIGSPAGAAITAA
jgi:4-hydroxy-tetrahydrodipicolinate synthase